MNLFNSEKMNPYGKSLIAILITGVCSYLASCIHILSKLDSLTLITQVIAEPNSSASPVYFPIAGPITDAYWKLRGRKMVIADNLESNRYIEYLSERMSQARERSERVDMRKANDLLHELVCMKPRDDDSLRQLWAFQAERGSSDLASALRECAGEHL